MLSKMQPIQSWRFYLLAISFLALLATGCTSRTAPQEPGPTATSGTVDTGPGIEGFASVTVAGVDRRQLSRIVTIPSHAILPAGETIVFSAVVYDDTGKALDPAQVEARWRITDPQAGTITSTGVFRAGVQRGVFNNAIEVSISQELDRRLVTLQALASVSIIRPLSEMDISRVQVLPGKIQMEPELQVGLTALALDRDGVPIPGVDYSWEMVNSEAGSIDIDGRFTSGSAVGSFPAAIRVVAQKREDPTQTVAAMVPVEIRELGVAQPPSKVNLYPQAVSLRPGDTMEFRALALDQRGNLFEDVEVSWVLRDPEAGDLDSGGQFRAGPTPGTYPNLVEVTVTPLGVGTPVPLKATATVTVLEPVESPERLQRLLLTPQVVRLRPGESIRLTATALSHRGEVIPSAAPRWSGREDVVDVSPDGVVTAGDRPGTYADAVMVEVTEGEGEQQVRQTACATLIVLGPLARVEVVPQQVQVAPRQVVQFTYIAYDINGVRLFDLSASWEVLDERAGMINDLGLFIAGETPGEYGDVIRVTVRPLRLGTSAS